jgi:type IV pilus assembly protein PilY1
MTRTSRWLVAATLAALLAAPAAATTPVCQIPLAIGANTGNANVLLLLDNSGSMNEALVPSAYNPSTNYSGPFWRTWTYGITTSGDYSPKSFNSSWSATPTAYLVASDQGEAGDYKGNYLNWVYFHATPAQRAAIPVVTRIQAAKATVNSFLATITDCRLGLEVFESNSNGGTILAGIGSAVGTIQTTVTGIRAQTMTPLGESMVTAMNYFKLTGVSAPIQAPCQKTFVIIVTDGLPTSDTNFPWFIRDANRDGYYLDDVASYMYRNDMRPDMDGIQNVATFTVGFNVDGALLQRTANVGGGQYFNCNDATGLNAALTSAFNVIAARVAAGAAVSVVASEDRSNNRLFRARYESLTWRGFLEAFSLPYHSGDTPLWDAGALLAARSASSRTILTSTNGTTFTPFTTSNASALMSPLGAPDMAGAYKIISYVRGDSVPGTRGRGGWKLGDIVDPAPVMVGKPAGYSELPGYTSYRVANTGRREVVYVAANDGMLHCFDVNDGTELWSYIPNDQLSKLSTLLDPAYCHNYFLNMTPGAYDIYLNGGWRTVVVGGEAQGGNGLFALDVTSPAADSVSLLWDVSHAALKGAWAPPTMVRDRQLGRSVMCIGTGYDANVAQANLLVLDPVNGSILRTFPLGAAVAGNKVTKAVAFDSDFDGYEDRLYMGDLSGKLYRVDLTTNPWTVTTLYSGSQPIQGPPALTVDELGRALLCFGTGRFVTAADPGSLTMQSIYGIIDDNTSTVVTRTNLVDQTSSITGLTSGQRGWYIDLANSGERIIRNAVIIAGTLYVPSFAPTASACSGGSQSWLYSLDFRDGSAPDHVNGAENNTISDRSQSMGDGILADPTVDMVNEQLILQSSNAVLLTEDLSENLRKLAVRSWRQRWN